MKCEACECLKWAPTYPVFRDTYHHPDCPWKPECATRQLTPAEAERAFETAPAEPITEARIKEIVEDVLRKRSE